MTRLEYFKNYGTIGVDLGLIAEAKLAWYIRFCIYTNYLIDGKESSEAIKLTANECNCSEVRVYKAVQFFIKKRIK